MRGFKSNREISRTLTNMVIHAYYDLSHVSKESMRGAYAEHRVSVIDTCEELAILLNVKLLQEEIEVAKKKLKTKF